MTDKALLEQRIAEIKQQGFFELQPNIWKHPKSDYWLSNVEISEMTVEEWKNELLFISFF